MNRNIEMLTEQFFFASILTPLSRPKKKFIQTYRPAERWQRPIVSEEGKKMCSVIDHGHSVKSIRLSWECSVIIYWPSIINIRSHQGRRGYLNWREDQAGGRAAAISSIVPGKLLFLTSRTPKNQNCLKPNKAN